ncbi:MAG: NAD-dependent deacetylase [Gammaproteobacteria bacterium]|nr:NAD-dependent deacetylase [Gammaproteobacteria bacterium]
MDRQTLSERIEVLAGLMSESNRIVLFTGAGISTDSGLPDFRGPDGVWTRRDKGLPPKDEDRDWSQASPNISHNAIVELQSMGKLHFLVSQNIDNLHLASGIKFEKLAELHGNMTRSRCKRCEETYPKNEAPDRCSCGGSLKSSVVGFGDSMPTRDLNDSFACAESCDLMIVLGSSLVVTPAATVPQVAHSAGAKLVIVNQGETPLDRFADLRFDESIVEVFPPAVDQLKILVSNRGIQ